MGRVLVECRCSAFGHTLFKMNQMSSSLDHKCQRCGSQYHGQICPFCTITGLDVNALLAAEGMSLPGLMPASGETSDNAAQVMLVDVVSNRTFPCSTPVCRFGRDISNDIVLTGDKSLSRFHFQVTVLNGEYFVEDAGSRNGTFLNGSPVNSPKKVLNGDIISAGMSRYRFVLAGEGEELGSGHAGTLDSGRKTVESTSASSADPMGTTGDMSDLPRKFKQLQEQEQLPATENPPKDPLVKIFEEGQALMSSADQSEEEDGVQSSFEVPAEPESSTSHNGHHNAPVSPFEAVPKEMPIDELFQEQLRAMHAAGAGQSETASEGDSGSSSHSGSGHTTGKTHDHQHSDTSEQHHSHYDEPAAMHNQMSTIEEKQAAQSNREWPTWCKDFSFKELSDIHTQIEELEELIAAKKTELDDLRLTVNSAEHVKNSLLATKDQELIYACAQVFQLLGWDTAPNGSASNELVLSSDNTAAAIVKIVCTTAQPKPQELGNLVGSLSTYWSENGVEPKGILLVAMVTDGPPEQRPTLSQDYSDYASKKNVCLMSSLQLLAIYRETALRGGDVESIKSAILAASGHLSGFELSAVATA